MVKGIVLYTESMCEQVVSIHTIKRFQQRSLTPLELFSLLDMWVHVEQRTWCYANELYFIMVGCGMQLIDLNYFIKTVLYSFCQCSWTGLR